MTSNRYWRFFTLPTLSHLILWNWPQKKIFIRQIFSHNLFKHFRRKVPCSLIWLTHISSPTVVFDKRNSTNFLWKCQKCSPQFLTQWHVPGDFIEKENFCFLPHEKGLVTLSKDICRNDVIENCNDKIWKFWNEIDWCKKYWRVNFKEPPEHSQN